MNNGEIGELADRLRPFRDGIAGSREWQAAEQMADVLGMLRRRHLGVSATVDRARVEDAVSRYLHRGQVAQVNEVFDLCLGAGWLNGEGQGILTNRLLRRRLFDLAATVSGRGRRLKAFRGLLFAYWSLPRHAPSTSREAIEGWRELRGWLQQRHDEINRHPARKPTWFAVLAPYRHLLEENPCARYAESVLRGRLDELQQAIDCLFIPADSWLKTEAVLAPITAAAQWPDADFRAALPPLLKLATGAAGIQIGAGVTRRALGALLMRYARLEPHRAHEELFALAVEKIGNPWREQAAWDACVRDARDHPCALSREMVTSWLRDKIVGEFFVDSAPDAQRRELWLRYSVFMAAIAVVSPGHDGNDHALLARLGELLLRIPRERDQPVDIYPWHAVSVNGGTKLLDADTVDGAAAGDVLQRCKPILRLSQISNSRCETELGNFLFAKDLRRSSAVPRTPTRQTTDAGPE